MVVSMVEKKMDEGVKVFTIIADDDTTTISRLRQSVNPAIQKKSDRKLALLILFSEQLFRVRINFQPMSLLRDQ